MVYVRDGNLARPVFRQTEDGWTAQLSNVQKPLMLGRGPTKLEAAIELQRLVDHYLDLLGAPKRPPKGRPRLDAS